MGQPEVMNLQAQAMSVANELKILRNDPHFVVGAKVLVEALSSKLRSADAHEQDADIAKPLEALMADTEFMKDAETVGLQIKAVMDTPIVQEEMELFTEQMQTIVASLHAQEPELQGRRLSIASPTGTLSRSLMNNRPTAFALPQQGTVTRNVKGKATEFKSYPVLGKIGELKAATALANLGLLSAAEKAGLFSALEKAGLLSQAEKLLPLLDTPGVLDYVQNAVDKESKETFFEGAALIALGPIWLALTAQHVLPPIEGPALVAPVVVFTGATGAGILLITLASFIGQLQIEGTYYKPKGK